MRVTLPVSYLKVGHQFKTASGATGTRLKDEDGGVHVILVYGKIPKNMVVHPDFQVEPIINLNQGEEQWQR